MPELEALPEISETPEIETSLEAPETPLEPSETPEAPEDEETPDEGQEDEPVIANGRLSEKTKAALLNLKQTDPKLATQLRDALYGREELKKHFPEGWKEAVALKTKFEDLGGEQGITTLQEDLQGWEALDTKYMTNPGEFVSDVASRDPQAFVKMVTAAISHFQNVSSDGYGQFIGQQITVDMQAAGIPLALARLADLLPTDNPRLVEQFNLIANYLYKFDALARQQVKPVGKGADVDQREQQLSQREREITTQTWTSEAGSTRMGIFSSEYRKLGVDKLSTPLQGAIKELYGSRMVKALNEIPNFKETVDRYFAAGNKEGYLRYMSAKYKETIPKVLAAAVRQLAPGRKTATPTPPKPGTPVTPASPTGGFIRLAKSPSRDMIDYDVTSTSMVLNGKAVLKDGRKVQWR